MRMALYSSLSPGDIIVMSCAIRELARAYPRVKVAVRTSIPDVWRNNPYLSSPDGMPVYEVGYTRAIQVSNTKRLHFASGYVHELNAIFGLRLKLSDLRPDLHLSTAERNTQVCGVERPYWVVVAGGKRCFVTKWWDPAYYQRVVEQVPQRWVQIGRTEHVHSPLRGVVNLLDRTTLREALILIANSEGVLCPLTFAMHAAAAFNKPCVCVAGGREPWWWEAYTDETWRLNVAREPPSDFVPHVFMHSIGELPCSMERGCWRTQVDSPDAGKNCTSLKRGPTIPQPECLNRITPEAVAAAIRGYGLPRKRLTVLPSEILEVNIAVRVS